ncbi:MAG: FixH family protein [Phycisphaerales bacterium]
MRSRLGARWRRGARPVGALASCQPSKPTPSTTEAPPAVAPVGAVASAAPGSAADEPIAAPRRVVSNDGSYIVLFTTKPDPIPANEPFDIVVRIYDARRSQQIVTDADLVVDAAMPEHRHGMNVVPRVRKHNDGSYSASGMLFHMPGRWEIYFDITRKGETERAQAEVVLE